MTISLREACNCIGLKGNISIIGDFYGYSRIPAPFTGTPSAPGIETLSLLQQVRLIKNNSHVRLHIKIVAPAGAIFNPTIDQQLSAMRQVYASFGIAVVVRSVETLALPGSFFDIYVDFCTSASSEMISLFQNLNNVPTSTFHFENPSPPHNVTDTISCTEIVVYFVSTVSWLISAGKIGFLNGCAAYPNGSVIESIVEPDPPPSVFPGTRTRQKLLSIPGAVIAGNNASIWTLAHEVGHVFGLEHIEEVLLGSCPKSNPSKCLTNSLMTCCSTSNIINPPPDLSAQEISTIILTGLKLGAFKNCGDP